MGTPRKKILLVEDEFIVAQAASRHLADHGFDVSYVLSGEEAIDTVKGNPPVDLVLMDLLLGPGMGGHEAARDILKLRDIPIIFLTSHNEKEIVERVREIPHYGYVLKSSGEFALVSTIEAALERHRTLRELRSSCAQGKVTGDSCRAMDEDSPLLVDHMLNGFARCRMIHDDSGRAVDFYFIDANHAFGHITGSGDVAGKKATEVFPGLRNDHREVFERFHRIASTGIPEKFEAHIKPLSLWLTILAYSCRKGEFTAIFENITEQRKSEEEAKYAQHLYRLVFDHSQEGMFLTAPDGRIFDCNSAATHMLGYSRDEILALGREGLVAPENPHLPEGLKKRAATGHASGELIFIRKDGSRLITECTSSLFTDQHGELRSSTFIRDITGRRQMEQELQIHRAHLEEIVEKRTMELQQANQSLEAESAAHRHARREVEAMEAELRLTLEATTDGIWSWTLPASLSFSPRYYSMLGYEPGEFPAAYENWVTLIHPEDREKALSVADRYLKTKRGRYENTLRLRTREGGYRWIRTTGFVVERDSEGNALRIIGNHEDITERKELEISHQKNETLFRSFFESPGVMRGIVEVENDDILHIADNEETAVFFGRTRESMAGRFASEMGIAREYLQTWIGHYTESLRQGRPVRFEYCHETPDGERWLAATVSFLEITPGGNPRFSYAATDITEIRQMQIKLKKTNEELDLFRKIVDASSEAIAISEPSGLLMYINPAHESLFGRSLDEARTLNYRDYYPPGSIDILENEVSPALARGDSWEGVLKVNRADGALFDLWERADSVRKEDGSLHYAFGFMHDETPRVNAEKQLRNTLREKELLLSEIHHRVKNNLNTVSNLLSLQERQVPDPALKKAFQDSRDRIQSIAHIHETLYNTGNLAAIDCGKYFQGFVESISLVHSRPEIRFTINANGISLGINTAIPVALITNEMVTNSLKYAFPGGREGIIAINLSTDPDGMCTLAISDDGIGLPDDLALMETRSLGMQIVQGLTSQLRAAMEIRREKGTTCILTFTARQQ
jgi:PAS domain S-box-containing protein